MKRYKYKKIFTRDQTLTEVESWYFAHEKGIECWYQGERPEIAPMILYVSDGAEETWHSTDQYKWICDTLQKQIGLDKDIVHNAILKYEEKMAKVKTTWARGRLDSLDETEEFIDNFFAAAAFFPVWYYAAVDERTPRDIREEAMEVRNQDLFYDECDRVVRNTFRHLFPKLRGYETVILKDELRSLPDIKILKKRKQNFVFIPGRAAEITALEDYVNKHPEIVLLDENREYDRAGKIIKGQTAYGGVVRGKAKIIRRLDQMDKVKKGDILVSPMTTPNFLAAMKKAAAFVTDEGGITCHAAIVARELKKPCIIGTKIATKVLKDGDLVGVDAEKGVVRILKNK